MDDKIKTLDTLKNEIFLSKENLRIAEEALSADRIPYELVKKIMEVGGYSNKINALRKAYLMGIDWIVLLVLCMIQTDRRRSGQLPERWKGSWISRRYGL